MTRAGRWQTAVSGCACPARQESATAEKQATSHHKRSYTGGKGHMEAALGVRDLSVPQPNGVQVALQYAEQNETGLASGHAPAACCHVSDALHSVITAVAKWRVVVTLGTLLLHLSCSAALVLFLCRRCQAHKPSQFL